jgi:quercetin dioxygenase-like cupin family protein
MQKKSFNEPDKTTTLPKTKLEVVTTGNFTLIRNTFEPGWKWSEHVKPTAGTDSCQAHHVLCMLSGRLKAVMDDGAEIAAGPGDVVDIPPGHDAWVVGDEPVVGIDIAAGAS